MPAESKSQQRFMGMVHAYKTGTLDTSKLPDELVQKIKKAAHSMTKKEVDDFASTEHKGLPEKKASMKKEAGIGQAATSMAGSLVGGLAGGAIQDKRYRDKAKRGIPIPPDKHVAEVMKGILVGGGAGALLGHGAAAKAVKIKANKADLRALEETTVMLKGLANKQKKLVGELGTVVNKQFAKDFPEVSEYKLSKGLKMTDDRIVREFGSKRGISATRMQEEILKDFEDQTVRRIHRNTRLGRKSDRKAAFKRALRQQRIEDVDSTNLFSHMGSKSKKIFGFDKLGHMTEEHVIELMNKTAARYKDQLYKTQIRDVPVAERVGNAATGSGVISAIGTTGISAVVGAKHPLR